MEWNELEAGVLSLNFEFDEVINAEVRLFVLEEVVDDAGKLSGGGSIRLLACSIAACRGILESEGKKRNWSEAIRIAADVANFQ